MPYISVILPIYNVEAYLDRCLSSIASQNFSDFEVIMVDDGSTDRSSEICDNWAQRDARFHAVHKVNGGVSSARNEGLERVTGSFFTFIDPDDYLESGHFAALVEAQARHDADLVIGRFVRLNENGRIIAESPLTNEPLIERSSFIQHLPKLYEARLLNFVYPKLYRSSLFLSLRFDKTMKISEDAVWMADVLSVVGSIQLSNDAGYRNIRYDSRGLTKQGNLNQFDQHLTAYGKIISTAEVNGWMSDELLLALDARILVWVHGALMAIYRGSFPLWQKVRHANLLCKDPHFISAFDRQSSLPSKTLCVLRTMRKGNGFGALMEVFCTEASRTTSKTLSVTAKKLLPQDFCNHLINARKSLRKGE